jgi:hypothetical protein
MRHRSRVAITKEKELQQLPDRVALRQPEIFDAETWAGWSCIAEMRLKPKEYEPPVYLIWHQNKALMRLALLSAVRAGDYVEENGHGPSARRACTGATQPRQLPLWVTPVSTPCNESV